MSQGRGKAVVEGHKEDRISALPRDIINRILALLPAKDAAKTSILSKKWRYIWPMLPYLVLDYRFCSRVVGRSRSLFKQTVDEVLSRHLGDIVKFVLYVPEGHEELWRPSYDDDLSYEDGWPSYDDDLSYEDVDRWIRHVTRNGIKELTLYMPQKDEDEILYELPSYVFNLTMLTCLDLCYCAFKPPNSTLDFPKLETLHLEGVNIVPKTEFCVLNVPVLVNLRLIQCDGTQYLHIVSPLLEVLCAHGIHYLALNYFMDCKRLRELDLFLYKMVDNLKQPLEKLLFCLAPTLEKLTVDLYFLELLTAGKISTQPFFMLNCLWHISLTVDFGKLSHISGALQLIKSVPNLSKLEITVDDDGTSKAKAILKYLKNPACLDRSLNKLKHVLIRWFQGSKSEVLFIKLLFAHAPSLVRMSIVDVRPGSNEERSIPRELIGIPKASPNAELYFLP